MATKLSSKQRFDLRTVKFFIPDQAKDWPITDEDVKLYFAWSDRGVTLPPTPERSKGLQALLSGKTFREWHLKSWRQDVIEGTIYPIELVEDLPEDICRFAFKAFGFLNYDTIKQTWAD